MIILFLFIAGLFFGSFGYALISRIHNHTTRSQGRSLMMGRSLDDRTGRPLQRYQLIPLRSRTIDRIRHHKQSGPKLSYRYPLSEVMMGGIFVGSYYLTIIQYGRINDRSIIRPTVIRRCTINRGLSLLIIYDIQTYELHLPIRIITLGISLVPQFLGLLGSYPVAFALSLTMGGIMRGLYQGAKRRVHLRTGQRNEGLGRGDIYVAFLIGTLRSMIPTSGGLLAYTMSITEYFTISGVIGLVMTLLRIGYQYLTTKQTNITLQSAIPFIPALIIGYRIILVRYSI